MKAVFAGVINRGGYDLATMLAKIDAYHVEGKLTDAERDQLYALARGSADPSVGADVMAKLVELEGAVNTLKKEVAALKGETEGDAEAEEQPTEYVAGKWYYNGDRVTFADCVYTCTAPVGQVCTWSPAEYPAYWEKET